MKKCIYNIKLMKGPILISCNGKEDSDGIHFCNRRKCLRVIDPIRLSVPFGYKPGFVSSNGTIWFIFNRIHPPASNSFLSFRKNALLPCIVFHKSTHLHFHCFFPILLTLSFLHGIRYLFSV
ncbi:hypothetical protein HanRHA438_Chr06g0252791 [Helianthus annuus]|nr:hypothetical protein HanRHA438_Chr06g0252791 [Helianthus annuus]